MKKIIVWFFSFLLILNCSITSVFATSTELDPEENIVEEYDTSEDYGIMLMSETSITGTELKRKIIDTLVTYWLILNNYATELVSSGYETVYNFADYIISTNYLFDDSQKKVFEMKADEVVSNADNYDDVTSIVLDNQDMLDFQQAMAESNYQSSDIPVEDFIERGVTELGNNYIRFAPLDVYIVYSLGSVTHSNGDYLLHTYMGKPATSYEKVLDVGTFHATYYYSNSSTYISLYSNIAHDVAFTDDLSFIDVTFDFVSLDHLKYFKANVFNGSTTDEDVLVAKGIYDKYFYKYSGFTGTDAILVNYYLLPITKASNGLPITKSEFMQAMTVDTITPPTHIIDSDITSVLPSVKESTTLTIPLDSSPDTSSMSDEEIKAYITSLLADSVDSITGDTDSDSDNTETSTDTSDIFGLLKTWSDSILSLPKRIGEVADSISDLPSAILNGIVDIFIPSEGYFTLAFENVMTAWNNKFPNGVDVNLFKNFFNSLMGNTSPPEWYLPIPEELQQYMGTDKALIIDFSWFDQYRDILHMMLSLYIIISFLQRLPSKIEGMGRVYDK